MQAIGQGEKALADVLKQLAETKAEEGEKPTIILMVEWFTLFLRAGRLGGSFKVSMHRPLPDPVFAWSRPIPVWRPEPPLPTLEFELSFVFADAFYPYKAAVEALIASNSFAISHSSSISILGTPMCEHSITFHPVSGITETVFVLIKPLYKVDWATAEKLRILTNMDPSKLNYVERIMQELCRELLYYYEGVLNGTRTGFKDATCGRSGREQERLEAPLPRISSDGF